MTWDWVVTAEIVCDVCKAHWDDCQCIAPEWVGTGRRWVEATVRLPFWVAKPLGWWWEHRF